MGTSRPVTDAMVRAWCDDNGISMKPWEFPIAPWTVKAGPVPPLENSHRAEMYRDAQRIRAHIIGELKRSKKRTRK